MEPKPVMSSRQPGYPTRREVLAGAASFALVGLTGSSFLFAADETGKVTVAPVFAHGEGRGAMGCIVVSPPVFLSEEEGMQILREELAKHGIELKPGRELDGVLVPAVAITYKETPAEDGTMTHKKEDVELPDFAKPMKLSGVDSEHKIAVEFVSKKKYYDLGGPGDYGEDGQRFVPMVEAYDFKQVAERLVTLTEKQGKETLFLGVFYDPLTPLFEKDDSNQGETKGIPASSKERVKKRQEDKEEDWKAAWKRREKATKEESAKLLRQQAQDFVAWLKEKKAVE